MSLPEVTNDIQMVLKNITKTIYATEITQEAIDEAIKLSVKYQADKKTDKAIDLIRPKHVPRFNSQSEVKKKVVTASNIPLELAKAVNLPNRTSC